MRIFGTLIFAAATGLFQPVAAAANMPAPEVGAAPATALSEAMDEVRRGAWLDAGWAGDEAGPIGRAIVEWHRLRANQGNFDEALTFLRRYPDWPGLPYLRRVNEDGVPWAGRSEDVIEFFGPEQPATGHGTVALVRAYIDTGRTGDAQAQAVLAWHSLPLSRTAEAALLNLYPDMLDAFDEERADMALWNGYWPAAERAIERLDDDGWRALARARRALRAEAGNVDTLIEAVPGRLQTHPGLAYERFRWRLDKGRDDEAIQLILERSVSAETLGRPDIWSGARLDLAREKMREGAHDTAYALAGTHWLSRDGSDFAALEWLAGYVALRFRDDAAAAERHFRRFRSAVETPISLGRAGYWLGRALEAQGDDDGAAEAYAFGAEYQTSFYGLLAAERAGIPLDPELVGDQIYPPVEESDFAGSTVLEAALLLQAAGERDLAERFMVHLGESLDETELGSLTDVALSLGEPHIALLVAKEAARQGLTLPRPYFPVVELGVADLPVSRELALSIARRESEFDPGVASGVGASGLMQLMPGTAQDVARALNVSYSRQRLFSDPSYNATLGSAYLAGLIRRFGENVVLVSSGYNAGPGRPLRWMEERGDPRSPAIDVIDWIEAIPFSETRNYVMRVAESIPVYRARLTGETGPIRLTEELKGR